MPHQPEDDGWSKTCNGASLAEPRPIYSVTVFAAPCLSREEVQTPRPASLWKGLKDRFGLFELALFGLGTVLTIAVATVLSILWYQGEVAHLHYLGNNMLTYLALRDWLPEFVTLVEATLRFAVGALTAICCMMLASLALQKASIHHPTERHQVSVLQEASPGASTLLLPFARAALRGRFTREWVFVLLMFITSGILQFSSTILLSDFRETQFVGQNMTIPVNFTSKTNLQRYASGGSRPLSYPLFAEMAEGRNEILSTASQPGLFDTGNVSRAYLPLSAPQRTRVRHYQGFATVLTSHTICLPPNITRLQPVLNIPPTDPNDPGWAPSPNLTLIGIIPGPGRGESGLYEEYWHEGRRSWNVGAVTSDVIYTRGRGNECPPLGMGGMNICPFMMDVFADTRSGSPRVEINDDASIWHLVTEVEVSPRDASVRDVGLLLNHSKPIFQYAGSEWSTRTYRNGTASLTFHHSLCISRTIFGHRNITALASGTVKLHKEPGIPQFRSLNATFQDKGADLSFVMRQMGVDSKRLPEPEERNILNLIADGEVPTNISARNHGIDIDYASNVAAVYVNDVWEPASSQYQSYGICVPEQGIDLGSADLSALSCQLQGEVGDPVSIQLFKNAWRQSGALALGFEALATYSFLSTYTALATDDDSINDGAPKFANVSFVSERLAPRTWVGFGLVMGVLSVHIALMIFVAVDFIRSGRFEVVRERDE